MDNRNLKGYFQNQNFLNNQNYVINFKEANRLKIEFIKDLIWIFYEKYLKITTLYNKLEKYKDVSLKYKLLFVFLNLLIIIWGISVVIAFSTFYYNNILLENDLILLLIILIILSPILFRLVFFFGLLFVFWKKPRKVINYLFIKTHFNRWYVRDIQFLKVEDINKFVLIIISIFVYLNGNLDEFLIFLFVCPILYFYYPILLWLLIVIIILYHLITRWLLIDLFSSHILVYKIHPVYEKLEEIFLRSKEGQLQIGNILYLIKK